MSVSKAQRPAGARRLLSAVALSFLAAGALSACSSAPPKVYVATAPGVDFAKCESFGWLPSAQVASFTEQWVREAALRQLREKGYAISDDKPACRMTYLMSFRERPQYKPSVSVGASGGTYGVSGAGIGVSIPVGENGGRAGEFTLDVVDVGAKAQIWSGTVEVAFESGKLTQQDVEDLVRIVLAEYPDQAAVSVNKDW